MSLSANPGLLAAFQGLRIASILTRPSPSTSIKRAAAAAAAGTRPFSITTSRPTWIEPRLDRRIKKQKGRARVATGGSMRGTTMIHGDWGLRMVDFHRRISAKSLKDAVDAIKTRFRGEKFKIFPRVCCNHGVFTSGNEVRMGKGKGSFDYWSTRVALNQIVIEVKGMMHEQVARDALRLAGQKLPGTWRVAKKGDPPIVGKVQLTEGITVAMLRRPRKVVVPPVASKVVLPPASLTSSSPSPP